MYSGLRNRYLQRMLATFNESHLNKYTLEPNRLRQRGLKCCLWFYRLLFVMSHIPILAAEILAIHSRPDNANDKSDRDVRANPHNCQ